MAFSDGWRGAPLDRLLEISPGHQEVTPDLLKRSKLPQRFWGARIPLMAPGVMQRAVSQYVQKGEEMVEKGIGLLVHGGSPSARTWFASIGIRWALSCGLSALFVDATQMKSSQIENKELAARLGAVDLLVIDGLGRGHKATEEHGRETFGELLRVRTGAKRITWVTLAIPLQAEEPGQVSLDFSFPDEFELMTETMIPLLCSLTVPGQADPGLLA